MLNCTNIPIIQNAISTRFFINLRKVLLENFVWTTNLFSLDMIKKTVAIAPDKKLNKKHIFRPYKSDRYPPQKVPAKTEKVFDAKIVVDDFDLSFIAKKLE